jgi:hypothetical protein
VSLIRPAPQTDPVPGVAATAAVGHTGDRLPLRWGPIWAGALTALGVFLLLSLLAIAVGVQAAPGTDEDLGAIASIVTSIIALVSFFIGGFVAAWSAEVAGNARGLLNGFLVWALWLVLILLLAAFGASTIFGAATELFGQIAVPQPGVEPNEVISGLRQGAWGSLLALALTAAAAALGGVVGSHEEVRTRFSR